LQFSLQTFTPETFGYTLLSSNVGKECLENLVRKLPFGRQRRRWEYDNKMGVTERGCEDGSWIEVAQDRVNTR
jgi:hypothetical protein